MILRSIAFWSTILAAAVITKFQIDHHRAHPEFAHLSIVDTYKDYTKQAQDEGATYVRILGRDYLQEDVHDWFRLVDGRYCYKGGYIYPLSDIAGDPLTYRGFVRALQQGYHFPELEGAGARSDGQRVLLQHHHLSDRSRKPGMDPSSRVHLR